MQNTHILLVDTNNSSNDRIRDILELDDVRVTTTDTVEGAMAQLANGIPSVILMDLAMDGRDGFPLIKYIRESEVLKNIPLLYLTQRESGESVVRGLEAGADDFVHKDARPLELRKRVANYVGIHTQFIRHSEHVLEHAAEEKKRNQTKDILVRQIIPQAKALSKLASDPAISRSNSAGDDLRNTAANLHSTLCNLLDSGMCGDSGIQLNPEQSNLADIVANVLESWKDRAYSECIEVRFTAPQEQDACNVSCDPAQVTRALNQMLEHAFSGSTSGDSIQVRAEPLLTGAAIFIESEAPGLSEEEQGVLDCGPEAHDQTEKSDKSEALGLAIARKIVEAQDGWIGVRQRPQGGSVIYFSLPGQKSEGSGCTHSAA